MNKSNKSGESLSPCATPVFCPISFDRNSPSVFCWKLHYSTDCNVCRMFPWSPSFMSCKQQVLIYDIECFFVASDAGIYLSKQLILCLTAFFKCKTASIVDSLVLKPNIITACAQYSTSLAIWTLYLFKMQS